MLCEDITKPCPCIPVVFLSNTHNTSGLIIIIPPSESCNRFGCYSLSICTETNLVRIPHYDLWCLAAKGFRRNHLDEKASRTDLQTKAILIYWPLQKTKKKNKNKQTNNTKTTTKTNKNDKPLSQGVGGEMKSPLVIKMTCFWLFPSLIPFLLTTLHTAKIRNWQTKDHVGHAKLTLSLMLKRRRQNWEVYE